MSVFLTETYQKSAFQKQVKNDIEKYGKACVLSKDRLNVHFIYPQDKIGIYPISRISLTNRNVEDIESNGPSLKCDYFYMSHASSLQEVEDNLKDTDVVNEEEALKALKEQIYNLRENYNKIKEGGIYITTNYNPTNPCFYCKVIRKILIEGIRYVEVAYSDYNMCFDGERKLLSEEETKYFKEADGVKIL